MLAQIGGAEALSELSEQDESLQRHMEASGERVAGEATGNLAWPIVLQPSKHLV